MRKILLALLCLVVAGCASIQNPLNITRLAQVESAYGLALSAASGYRALYEINRCTVSRPESATNICARRSVVLKLQAADLKAQAALKFASEFTHNNPTIDASSMIGAASSAVAAFKLVADQTKVR